MFQIVRLTKLFDRKPPFGLNSSTVSKLCAVTLLVFTFLKGVSDCESPALKNVACNIYKLLYDLCVFICFFLSIVNSHC